MDPILKYLAIGRQLGYGMYLSLDAVTYVSLVLSLEQRPGRVFDLQGGTDCRGNRSLINRCKA